MKKLSKLIAIIFLTLFLNRSVANHTKYSVIVNKNNETPYIHILSLIDYYFLRTIKWDNGEPTIIVMLKSSKRKENQYINQILYRSPDSFEFTTSLKLRNNEELKKHIIYVDSYRKLFNVVATTKGAIAIVDKNRLMYCTDDRIKPLIIVD